jgi:hypothetical protein
MVPFVAKFRSPAPEVSEALTSLSYDPVSDCSILQRDRSRVIESDLHVLELSGSFCTRAANDPTSDESTDR